MVWGKRRFRAGDAGFMPHMKRLKDLMTANTAHRAEFVMVRTKVDDRGGGDYYIGVPNRTFLVVFDGFEVINERDVPHHPQAHLVGDVGASCEATAPG